MIFQAEHPDGMRVVMLRGCTLLDWHEAPTPVSVKALLEAFEAYESEHGKQAPSLSIALIGGGSAMPQDGAREGLSEIMDRFPVDRASLIVSASGFRGSITRSILAAVGLAAGARGTQRVFSELGAALEWVVQDEADARSTFEELFAAMAVLSPEFQALWKLAPGSLAR